MKSNVKSEIEYTRLLEKIRQADSALRVTDDFNLPTEGSNFHAFVNNLTSGSNFCNSSSRFLDDLVNVRRTCSSSPAAQPGAIR